MLFCNLFSYEAESKGNDKRDKEKWFNDIKYYFIKNKFMNKINIITWDN
jgi:hypothetical protein